MHIIVFSTQRMWEYNHNRIHVVVSDYYNIKNDCAVLLLDPTLQQQTTTNNNNKRTTERTTERTKLNNGNRGRRSQ